MAGDPLLRRFQRGSCLSLRAQSTWPLGLDHAGLGAGDRALDRQFLRVQSVCGQLWRLHGDVRRDRRCDCHHAVVLRFEHRDSDRRRIERRH